MAIMWYSRVEAIEVSLSGEQQDASGRSGEIMATHTIEVTGISDELLRRLDERVRESGGDRAEFVRELIQKELQEPPEPASETSPHAGMTFQELLAPVHRQVSESGMSDEEVDQFFEDARERVRKEKETSRARQ